MANLFRSIVVWLMLLALPLQGFASVAMACADGIPAADAIHAAAPMAAAQAGGMHHDHAAMLAKADGGDHHSGHGTLKCGGAACCVGAALAPCLPVVQPALPLAAAPTSPYSGFLPAVDLAHPERPPQGQRA